MNESIKRKTYIWLFAILYIIVAFSSFYHAVAFFGLANNMWMSIILAGAFEVGQAAVLLSLLTSKQERTQIMPWVLMSMFTVVQVIGNVFSSYKYLVTHSSTDLQYFKEPIFIWTDIPDNEANVIITYIVGAILPITALLLTSMVTNYLKKPNKTESIIVQDVPETKIVIEPEETHEIPVQNEIVAEEKTGSEQNQDEQEETFDEQDEIHESEKIEEELEDSDETFDEYEEIDDETEEQEKPQEKFDDYEEIIEPEEIIEEEPEPIDIEMPKIEIDQENEIPDYTQQVEDEIKNKRQSGFINL